MTKTYKTIRECAELWVSQMNAIPRSMIEKLINQNPDEWSEVTKPDVDDRVYVYEPANSSDENFGNIVSYDADDNTYCVELDDGNRVYANEDEFEVDRESYLPMWGTMWSFGENIDDWWLEECGGIKEMAHCGFRIYHSEDYGYFFGIDGAGYDFYEHHWIPLYKARGIKWHDIEDK